MAVPVWPSCKQLPAQLFRNNEFRLPTTEVAFPVSIRPLQVYWPPTRLSDVAAE